MFVEHFIQRVPEAYRFHSIGGKGVNYSLYRELWITFPGYFNHSLQQSGARWGAASIRLHACGGPGRLGGRPHAWPPSIFLASSHKAPSFSPLWFLLTMSKCGNRKWEHSKNFIVDTQTGPLLPCSVNVIPKHTPPFYLKSLLLPSSPNRKGSLLTRPGPTGLSFTGSAADLDISGRSPGRANLRIFNFSLETHTHPQIFFLMLTLLRA